jgi:2-succinyl-6-hydroxy-2,4-cyclohexadiene-1-carboxylate synthase
MPFTIAIAGDLTAIYDRNGLLAAPGEPHPHLVYVVIDNDGGGIFSELEQGAPEFAVDYERVFGTPHGARLTSLLDAPGVTRHEAADATRLREALELSRVARGVHIIAVSTLERQTQVDRLRSFSEDAS